eukprot:1460985-Rhodomonas_salina.1
MADCGTRVCTQCRRQHEPRDDEAGQSPTCLGHGIVLPGSGSGCSTNEWVWCYQNRGMAVLTS